MAQVIQLLLHTVTFLLLIQWMEMAATKVLVSLNQPSAPMSGNWTPAALATTIPPTTDTAP